jgi:hypothetical protein
MKLEIKVIGSQVSIKCSQTQLFNSCVQLHIIDTCDPINTTGMSHLKVGDVAMVLVMFAPPFVLLVQQVWN